MDAMKFDIQMFARLITGTSASDLLIASVDNCEVYGVGGDDIFSSHNKNFVLMMGAEGDDKILNTGGSNITLWGEAGNDTINNKDGSNVKIDGGVGNDSIYNNGGSNVTINGSLGNDTIRNNGGSNISINGGAGGGADVISLSGSSNVTITGGGGDDTIYNNGGSNISIYGGAGGGADVISLSGSSNVTIMGGGGDDTIYGTSGTTVLYQYPNEFSSGNGNDVIYNFNSNDVLQISDSYSTMTSGNDIIVNVGNDSIRLKNAAGISLHINESADVENNSSSVGSDSRDFFVYANGDGNRTISNFKAGSSNNSDVVYLQGNLGTIEREGNTVTVNGASGGSLVIETDFSTDEAILYTIDGTNIGAAKLADSTNTLYYDKNVYHFRFNDNAGRLFYWGNEDVTIALDNSTAQDYVGLKTIITKSDTEKAQGNLRLIGNDLDNEIYSGAGNDTLTGGSGADRFYWGNGDGYDIITDAENADIIDLYNVSINDVAELNTSNGGISVRLNDGSQLTVNSQDATFQLADDTRWKYQGGNWQQQA